MTQIKGFENYIINRNGIIYNTRSGHQKQPTSNNNGYLYVDLYNNGNRKRFFVHRLVAKSFIPNPQNKPYINHIDGNPQNNNIKNLEWCSPLENVEHANKVLNVLSAYKIANDNRKKKIKMIDRLSGETISIFDSIRDAERKTKIKASNIVANLKGRQTYTKNYIWCYVEENGYD